MSGAPYHHLAFRLADLSVEHIYPTDAYPDAVAVAPDGTVAAGIDNSYGPDVYLFPAGADAPSQIVDLDPGSGLSLRPHGLAWSPDGSRLFALTGRYGAALTLHVIDVSPDRSRRGGRRRPARLRRPPESREVL